MKLNQINTKFNQSIKWNAFFYTLRKGLSIFLTIILYKKLSMLDFSIWANIHSFIFLVLLWLDFGFRKSLPRYCPQFAKNKQCMKTFIRYIVTFQSIILVTTTIFFLLLAGPISYKLNILDKIDLLYLCCALFVLEGILSVMRLIYYSYFWQRQFNILLSIIILIKSAILLFFLYMSYTGTSLLRLLFIAEIVAGICATGAAIFMLRYLYKDKNYPGNQTIDFKKTSNAFIKHSGIMWVNTNLKSLTERNFLLILLTKLLGPYAANLFKLANDGALLFQRTVLKTIGTTDTSLLSYIQLLPERKKLLPIAFDTLIQRIASFTIPLLGLLAILIIHFRYVFTQTYIFEVFILITVCYLLEAMLSPYERILEIQRHYWILALSYLPYIFFIIIILCFPLIPKLGLLLTIILIHIIRLSSYLIMLTIVRRRYHLPFPIKRITSMFLIVMTASIGLSLIIPFVATKIQKTPKVLKKTKILTACFYAQKHKKHV